jgi:hypothetical protein
MDIGMPGDVLELLFVRDVWSLIVATDVPQCSPRPKVGKSRRPDVPNLEGAWSEAWSETLDSAVPGVNGWRPRHGRDGIDIDALRLWTEERRMGLVDLLRPGRGFDALRAAIDGLANYGIDRLRVLPVAGEWSQRRDSTLLISTSAVATAETLTRQVD